MYTLLVAAKRQHERSSDTSRENRSVQEQAVIAILRSADRVRRTISKPIEARGLSFQQYNVLRILRVAGKGGLPTLEIVDRLLENAPAITRLVDKLEEKKFVQRVRGTEDRRRVLCYITLAGLDLLESMDAVVLEAEKRAVGGLSDGKLQELIETLRQISRKPDG